MENKQPKRRQSHLKLTYVLKYVPMAIKKHFSEIVTGVVIGIIILIVTPFVNKVIENQTAQQRLVNDLSSVSLGMSKNYIDGLFGQPIIEREYEQTITWYSDYQTEETMISAGYKLADSVLLCLYCDKALEAFVVVVNREDLYRIPANIYINNCYLLDFTYADFSETVDKFEGNIPANNDDYLYYSELFYGAGPADYNYFIIGSYKDYRKESDTSLLTIMGQAHMIDFDLYNEEEHYAERAKIQPNVFGIVSGTFSDEFNFVFDVVGSRVNGALLFNDWFRN